MTTVRYAAMSALLAVSACAGVDDRARELALEPYVGRLVVLEEETGERFLFDTGGGVTALTPEAATRRGCEPFGELTGFRMSAEKVTFERCGPGTLAFSGYSAASELYVFDLMALLPEGLPPLDGVVSLASFARRPITVDLAHGTLTIETPDSLSRRIKSASEGELRVMSGAGGETTAFVRLKAQTGDLWFLLDSANLSDTLIAPHAFAQLGVKAGEDAMDMELEIAGVGAEAVRARKADIIYDGAFSEAFMRRFRITLDVEAGRIWFSPAQDDESMQ